MMSFGGERKRIKLEKDDEDRTKVSFPKAEVYTISDDETDLLVKTEYVTPGNFEIEKEEYILPEVVVRDTHFERNFDNEEKDDTISLHSTYTVSDEDDKDEDDEDEKIWINLDRNIHHSSSNSLLKPFKDSIQLHSNIYEGEQLLGFVELQERHVLEECSTQPFQRDQGDKCDQESSHIWYDENPGQPELKFTGEPGLKLAKTPEKPIEFFRLLANKELADLIITGTNSNANRRLEKEKFIASKKYKMKDWTNLTERELSKFLGILYFTGHILTPDISFLWRKNNLYSFPLTRVLSMERFLHILRVLDFERGQGGGESEEFSPLKVTSLIEIFENNMTSIYYPKRDLSLYEPIVLCRNKFSFRQYMPTEKYRNGIKIYMLTQADGLALKFHVHMGKADPDIRDEGHTNKVVTKLLNNYIGRGHGLYADILYNSVPLTKYLLLNDTYVTGILRRNRKGNPEEVCGKRIMLKRNGMIAQYSEEGICVSRWKGEHDMVVISSEYDTYQANSEYDPLSAHISPKPGASMKKRNGLIQYKMGTNNKYEHFLSNYPLPKSTLSFSNRLATLIFHIIMRNAYLLYNSVYKGYKMKLNDFRESVIIELLKGKLYEDCVDDQQDISMFNPHLPTRVESSKRKRCRLCFLNGRRRDSRYICDSCPGNPGFCIDKCFRLFHNY